METATEIPAKQIVSERALIARINRKWVKERNILRICPPNSRWSNDYGRYYSVSADTNAVTGAKYNLEALARELGVLRENEGLASE